jgi:hypothetical protein
MKTTGLLKNLAKRKTALYASLFAVIFVGTPHIVPLVMQFSLFKSYWASMPHATAYAFALEVGIVFFALRSKMVQTIVFAIIATSLYLGYYDNHIPWWTIAPIMPLIISISLPIMIVLIAHETGKKEVKKDIRDITFDPVEAPPKPKVSQNGLPKPVPEEIKEQILKLIDEGYSYRDVAKEVKYTIATISRVVNEKRNSPVNQ